MRPGCPQSVPADGVVMVAGQAFGRSHAGKNVAVVIGDTFFQVLDGDIELSAHVRTSDRLIKQFRPNSRTRQ